MKVRRRKIYLSFFPQERKMEMKAGEECEGER